jgi:hypothetical protein
MRSIRAGRISGAAHTFSAVEKNTAPSSSLHPSPLARQRQSSTVRYVYDPDTGRVSCPRHGSLDDFQPVSADTPRRRGPEEIVISAFGIGALRLRFEDGQLKATGTLMPAPQRVAERGSM